MSTALSKTTDFDYNGFTAAEVAYLKDAADKIQKAGQRSIENIFEMGHQLIEARKQFDQFGKRHGGVNGEWRNWIEQETRLSINLAGRVMQVTRKFGSAAPQNQLPPLSILIELASETAPEEVVTHVLENPTTSQRDVRRLKKDVTAQIENAKAKDQPLPTAKEAREIARTEGHPVVASNGKIYFGATEKEEVAAKERRALIYRAEEAINHIAGMNVTPGEWLGGARDWHLKDFNQHGEVAKAASWLERLDRIWRSQNG